jgi:hypothetical protein
MKTSRWIFCFFVMSLYGLIVFPVYAQERRFEINHPENWEEIAGKVESLNLDISMMVVKAYSGEEKSSYEEVTILITKEAKIFKDDQEFALKDLKDGDEITVRYILTADGQKAAYYLWVKGSGIPPKVDGKTIEN